jgi:hypothetical protein
MIPADRVRAWSDAYGADPERFQVAITRLCKRQRRLVAWMRGHSTVTKSRSTTLLATSMLGVVLLMFDLEERKVPVVGTSGLRAAERLVQGRVRRPAPGERPREVLASLPRAEAAVLDEILRALFDARVRTDDAAPIDDIEGLKVYVLLWIATEALAAIAQDTERE